MTDYVDSSEYQRIIAIQRKGKVSSMREKVDKKAIAKMDKIQERYGGRSPEYILMFFADSLNSLTGTLIALTSILAILTVVNILILVFKD